MTSFSFGLGLRTQHYHDFLQEKQAVDWLEVISDNYMVQGGKPLAMLDQIRANYPLVMHGVSLSIGASQGLSPNYLQALKTLAQRIEPLWISDHLCWTGVHGRKLHDLMPLPFTEEALQTVRVNVLQAQDVLGQPLVIENVSSYLEFKQSEMSEWEFLSELHARTGCKLLLDINNVYVSALNHGFDPLIFLDAIPVAAVQQFHLAGHSKHSDHAIDTHDQAVCEAVWQLYGQALERFGCVPTMIERDDNIPPLQELLAELEMAKQIAQKQRALEIA